MRAASAAHEVEDQGGEAGAPKCGDRHARRVGRICGAKGGVTVREGGPGGGGAKRVLALGARGRKTRGGNP